MKWKWFARAAGLVLSLAALMAVTASFAQARTPAPGYEKFAGCPSPEEFSTVAGCIYSVVYGGHFQMGNKDVPITNPITLSGGTEEGLANFKYNSKGGLTPAKQKVPGGVVGLTGLTWLLEILGSDALTLYAVTELAGQPKFVGVEEIVLPIKVHLVNSVLGNKCYVGSDSNPINLHLLTGTTNPPPPNTPISGKVGAFSVNESTGIVSIKESKYVDNSFAAPGATGCTLTLLGFIPVSINGLVNTQSGLPAPAGTNETIQYINTELVEIGLVYP